MRNATAAIATTATDFYERGGHHQLNHPTQQAQCSLDHSAQIIRNTVNGNCPEWCTWCVAAGGRIAAIGPKTTYSDEIKGQHQLNLVPTA